MSERVEMTPDMLRKRFRAALQRREHWHRHWQECYEFALPQRQENGVGAAGGGGFSYGAGAGGGSGGAANIGKKQFDRVFDATAPDAVEQLAASLLGEVTPPSGGWFQMVPGDAVPDGAQGELAEKLARAVRIVQGHFERSNFAVEIHQAYLDLVTVGTACLRLEEAGGDAPSRFRFCAVPVRELAFEERVDGRLDAVFRQLWLTIEDVAEKWPEAKLPAHMTERDKAVLEKHAVIEAVLPDRRGQGGYDYVVFFASDPAGAAQSGDTDSIIASGRFDVSPYIAFRWLKAPGEIYGRSPVMKALPDIKTANKVVELVLKNASIAVTGIWQADDDGILNPATVRLVPGSIIPKAVGSAGLTPLDAPGRFDVSDVVLADLRERIRRCLLTDRLGQVDAPRMTATEVLERAAENSRLLAATYSRLQAELIFPLMRRALHVLARSGELPDIPIDGNVVCLRHSAPMAQLGRKAEAGQVLDWLERLTKLGPDATGSVDIDRTVRWLADRFGVPQDLLQPSLNPNELAGLMMDLAGATPAKGDEAMPVDPPVGPSVETAPG
ncbi:portal protein [Thalassospira marina]|uniref:Phage tail protein n=1 Tax=Thalassospira marina TaxID=2048283 RepID=A0A2N3KZN6_9PROT|nr:portal protein [Thalassospira marina]PKR56034.1 phage tail protein [Thalassospira marina]